MKKVIFAVIFATFLLPFAGTAFAQEDIQKIPACLYCGMDRAKFAFSRTYTTYDDGSSVGTCSIHCLAIDLANNIDKAPLSIEVGDYNSKYLIDAEKAYWVMGGDKPGVMTKQAKWAFAKKDDAEKFIAASGGVLATFDEVMNQTYASMYTDIKMIRERRKMKKSLNGGMHGKIPAN